ncbi:MAG TPA: P1 family peptidase [Bacteroidaceae bacterium]|nr:P1 family peptidase [Bacteroidaceae bacterium]
MKRFIAIATLLLITVSLFSQGRIRDYGIKPGIFRTGEYNAITDVPGVKVGQVTIIEGEDVRTGVTAIIPHEGNLFRLKCPAAVYAGNGFGKLAGVTQIEELGNTESPIILTNTLSVAQGIEGVITYSLGQKGNESVGSVNAVVGETNDGSLNDIRGRHVTAEHVLKAIETASGGAVEEGCVGAGTGTVCFGFKGGIGTSSRVLPKSLGGYTVGVLVQSNYGGILEIDGVPVGQLLGRYSFKNAVEEERCALKSLSDGTQEQQLNPDGSCMMVVITDAPVDARNLKRIAKRAMMGLAKTGGIASNGSGDYVIALSVCKENLINESTPVYNPVLLHNEDMSALFEATIEATAEALWNSLFMATDMTGKGGRTVEALPVEKVVELMRQKR